MTTEKALLTAEELLRMPDASCRRELIRGEVREKPPAGFQHGTVAMELGSLLATFVRTHRLGKVIAAETGFILQRDPDTVRAPDVAFISQQRLPAGEPPTGFPELAPDLVAEVVSPGDTTKEVKVEEWLRAGVTLVWVVYPSSRSVVVYKSREEVSVLGEEDTLTGDPVLPGFQCQVRELF